MIVEFAPSGGLFHYALQLGEGLARRGHDVELLTGPNPELPTREPALRIVSGLPTWRPGGRPDDRSWRRRLRRVGRGLRYVLAWRQVLARTRSEQPDVVQLGDLRFGLEGHFVQRLRGGAATPVVVDLAHTPRPHSRRRGDPALQRRDRRTLVGLGRAYGSLDAAVVLGARSRDELLEAWPDIRRVEVVPHGVDGIFADTPVPAPDAAGPEILFFGNLDRYKGLELLIAAFALVRARVPTATLRIAGAPSAELDLDGLRARAGAVGGVELQLGYVPTPDVAALFGAARVVALPYQIANQSGVAHVAYGFGRPVVATDVGDVRDVVRDGETGLLVTPNDPKALADALTRVLQQPQLATRWGAAGRRAVTAGGSWNSIAEQLEALYVDLLARRSRAPTEGRR
jgi:glycosyltransferase involved in cell wall biosynthesis